MWYYYCYLPTHGHKDHLCSSARSNYAHYHCIGKAIHSCSVMGPNGPTHQENCCCHLYLPSGHTLHLWSMPIMSSCKDVIPIIILHCCPMQWWGWPRNWENSSDMLYILFPHDGHQSTLCFNKCGTIIVIFLHMGTKTTYVLLQGPIMPIIIV